MHGTASRSSGDFTNDRALLLGPAGYCLAGAFQDLLPDLHRDPFPRAMDEHPSPGPAPQQSHGIGHVIYR